MKIIKKGVRPEDFAWAGCCDHCKTEVECRKSEVKKIDYDQRDHSEWGTVVCPVCGGNITVYPTKRIYIEEKVRIDVPTSSPKISYGRTKSEVLAAQLTIRGCCDRHADRMACDCLALAREDDK